MKILREIVVLGLVGCSLGMRAEGAGRGGTAGGPSRFPEAARSAVVSVPGWPNGKLTVQYARCLAPAGKSGHSRLRLRDRGGEEDLLWTYVFYNWCWVDEEGQRHEFSGTNAQTVGSSGGFGSSATTSLKATSPNGEWQLEVDGGPVEITGIKNKAAVKLTRLTSVEIYPKYVILSVLYSPPGQGSSIGYYDGAGSIISSTMDGNFSENFTSRVGVGVGGQTMLDLGSGWTQNIEQSKSIVLKRFSNQGTMIVGKTDMINHDNDEFILWLNPSLVFDVEQDSWQSGSVKWRYDVRRKNLHSEMEIIRVSVGELKNPQIMSSKTASLLAREWIAPGEGLTGFDYGQILSANPFWNGVQKNLNLDDRFESVEKSTFCFDMRWSFGAETIKSEGKTVSNSYNVSTSQTSGINLKGLNLFKTKSNILTWTNTSTQSSSVSSSIQTDLELKSPGQGFTGPKVFCAYRDKVYGTIALEEF